MDVTRDDSAGATIIQGTNYGHRRGSFSNNVADQLLTTVLKNHFELTLQRSGTSLIVTLQKDANPAISGTDTTPTGFVFDEVALGVRSTAATDMRFDSIQVEYVAIPEPASIGLVLVGVCASRLGGDGRRYKNR